MKELDDVLASRLGSHVAPLMWVHGEDEETYRDEIRHIHDAGIDELCIEARPHDDFNGPGWFHDIGFILGECKRLGMRAWLLDDSHFPTGYANGEVKAHHPALRKKYLSLATYDVMGPITGGQVNLKYRLTDPSDEVVAILAQRRTDSDEPDVTDTIDLTATLHTRDDFQTGRPATDPLGNPLGFDEGACPVVDLDLPEGAWYVNVLKVSFSGGEKETEGYLNPIDPNATKVLLDTVYEPLFEHFGSEFGTTFQGFFSDEPRFGNIHGSERASIGRNREMPLPWRDDLLGLLVEKLKCTTLAGIGEDGLKTYLPLLFVGSCEEAHVIRCAYMDLVSDLYAECFDGVIATWCHEHGVRHIGHTIEDNNAVARLGYGAGHFFRAMRHADMAGIDVVMQQLMPGYDRGLFRAFHKPGWDMEFFTYVLGKLGGSLAHLDASKHGLCMAEVFGAYGWGEGNRLEKWLVDYMLVRGVNVFVPHAFSPKAFPDGDCPPHLYAQGKNPQYPEFRLLMDYTNRMASLLTGGSYDAPVALYFNAESEWGGDWQPVQRPAAELSRAQIEYDLVPADYLETASTLDETGRVRLGEERFRTIVIPAAEVIPTHLFDVLADLAEQGLPVWFVDEAPMRSCEGTDVSGALARLHACKNASVVSLCDLSAALVAADLGELACSTAEPFLRTYHYVLEGVDEYLFVNEHPSRRVTCDVTGAVGGNTYVYDAFDNRLSEDDDAFSLDIPPYGSRFVLVSKEQLTGASPLSSRRTGGRGTCVLEFHSCTLSLAPMEGGCTKWDDPVPLAEPAYVTSCSEHESFAGRIRYGFAFDLVESQVALAKEAGAVVCLEGVREAATVTVNNRACGTRIVGDYTYEVGPALMVGTNKVEVELNTTLGRAMDDFVGQFMSLEPCGLSGARLVIG